MVCPSCGYAENPPGANFCEQCGAVLTAAQLPVATQADPPAPDIDPADAATQSLPSLDHALDVWTCSCGAANPTSEEFCGQCGEQRRLAAPPLALADQFNGFEIAARLGDGSYQVRGEGSADGVLSLRFGDDAQIGGLVETLQALGVGDQPAAAVPRVVSRGSDPARGAWLVTASPEGAWRTIGTAPVEDPQAAFGMLTSLLGSAERAGADGRVLVLGATEILLDGGQVFLPAPRAPRLPLEGPLVADPVLVAPELKYPSAPVDGWRAGAYAAAAATRLATDAGLGLPPAWHTQMAALLSPKPEERPASAQDVAAALQPDRDAVAVRAHRSAFGTDIGHHHPVNQDAGGVWTWTLPDGTPITLAIVADGVSAGLHSEEAAAYAVQLYHDRIEALVAEPELDIDTLAAELRAVGLDAQAGIAAMPAEDLDTANASTLVAVGIIGAEAAGIWCGDSRAYGLTPLGARQLTRDHSWVNIVVDRGLLTLEEARRDPRAHVIARWLGPADPPRPDPGFDTFRRRFQPGERLLVCSDGLYMYFEPPAGELQEIVAAVYGSDSPDAAADQMVKSALDRGGFDNITAVLVAFD